MSERDGYIPGVPCWVDTNQTDPAKAAEFYDGLFGWELEDSMPEGADGSYLIGRIRGGDVGAISSPPEGGTSRGGVEHLHLGRRRRRHRQAGRAGGRVGARRALRRR